MTRCAICGRACEPLPISDSVPGAVSDWVAVETICRRRTCQQSLDRLEDNIDRAERMEIIRGWEMYTTPGHENEHDGCRRGRQASLDEFGGSGLISWIKDVYRTFIAASPTTAGDDR